MTPATHPDGTPKSTGNAFTLRQVTPAKTPAVDLQAKAKRVNPESNLGYSVQAQRRIQAAI